jgi:voltage-gated potassium channel
VTKAFLKVLPGIVTLLAVFASAVVAYAAQGWPLLDALYMVVITVFGVGYGEVRPIDTPGERWTTILLIVCGTTVSFYIIGSLIQSIAVGELRKAIGERRKTRDLEHLHNHAIICGYGRIGQTLAHELHVARFPFVIIEIDETRLPQASAAGYHCLLGDASDEETLVAAGVARAKILATVLPQDTLNVFITLTARNLNKNLRIISRGEQASTEKKLLQAGADEVVLPALMSGLRIAHSITRPSLYNYLNDSKAIVEPELKHLGIEVDELRLHHHTQLVGLTVRDVQRQAEGALLIFALKHADGKVVRNDFEDVVLAEGDALIVVGRTRNLPSVLRGEVEQNRLM